MIHIYCTYSDKKRTDVLYVQGQGSYNKISVAPFSSICSISVNSFVIRVCNIFYLFVESATESGFYENHKSLYHIQ